MYEHDENEVLRDVLSGLNEEVPPMPENLHAAWMQKVSESKMEKTNTRQSITRFLSAAAAMVFVIGGTLLTKDELFAGMNTPRTAYEENGSLKSTANYVYGAYTDEAAEAEYTMDAAAPMLTMARGVNAAPAVSEKKIIRTASLTLVTREYDTALAALKSSCDEQGGWLEATDESLNSRTNLRTAYLTLRIPQDSLDAYLEGTGTLGRVTSKSESTQDVTASYQDNQARLNTQLALMERLQALITESGDLSDLLALESQIADTQYQIDSLQSALNRTDRQVSYSAVTITLREETAPELTDTTVSFGDRIVSAVRTGWEAFITFLGDIAVFLVAALPFIAIASAVAIVVNIIRRRKK